MHSCAFSLVVNQALLVLLAYTLVQVHLVLRQRQELNRGVWEYTRQLLSPSLEVVAVYYRQRFCLLTLAEFGRILLDIPDPARAKLRENSNVSSASSILSWKIRGLRSPNIAHHNHSALQLAADASVERNPFPTGDARTSTFWPVHRHDPLPAAHPYPPDCRASVSPVFSFDDAPATLFASQSSPHCLNRRIDQFFLAAV